MTRIGFAYNQKPVPDAEGAPSAGGGDEAAASPADEPPSSAVRSATRSRIAAAVLTAAPDADDQFAEWDSPETIDAVDRALSKLGTVIRLEATAGFPTQPRAARPDIVFNSGDGLTGGHPETHLPALCEFCGGPYSGSDPFSLTLCLNKAR